MAKTFSTLEKNILKAKGMSASQLSALDRKGVKGRADLAVVGDAGTLSELVPGIVRSVAEAVMSWAGGRAGGGTVTVETSDVVYCVHCKSRQPKDYKGGDLCPACGKQAEPILACFWCAARGPGRFCRSCGAEFVPTAELDLALQLKRDGLPKDEIPRRLVGMSPADKDVLWGRVRKSRG
jgi:hypothetical protein